LIMVGKFLHLGGSHWNTAVYDFINSFH